MSKSYRRSLKDKVVMGLLGVSTAGLVAGVGALFTFGVNQSVKLSKAEDISKQVSKTSAFFDYETSVLDENRELLEEGKIDRETYQQRCEVDAIIDNFLRSTTNPDMQEQKQEYIDAKDSAEFSNTGCIAGVYTALGGLVGIGASYEVDQKMKEKRRDTEFSM